MKFDHFCSKIFFTFQFMASESSLLQEWHAAYQPSASRIPLQKARHLAYQKGGRGGSPSLFHNIYPADSVFRTSPYKATITNVSLIAPVQRTLLSYSTKSRQIFISYFSQLFSPNPSVVKGFMTKFYICWFPQLLVNLNLNYDQSFLGS